MMKNDTFESLVPGPRCSGPKSIGPKYFRAEVFSGPKLFRAEVFPGRNISGPKYSGPKYLRAEVSVGPKLSLGQTGCEPIQPNLGKSGCVDVNCVIQLKFH